MTVTAVAKIEAIFRYPVKSMRGLVVARACIGWHGLEGDRRFALRRIQDRGGFPWLSASKLSELVLFTPEHPNGSEDGPPTHIRTPEGSSLTILGEELASEIKARYGAPVEMMLMRHGIFDDATISIIATDTIEEISKLSGRHADIRRFRPNVVVRLLHSAPFQEDQWVGGELIFGEGAASAEVAVTSRDLRCSMVNLDPDSAASNPEIMKAIVRANENHAGVYGTVTRVGIAAVGQTVYLRQR